MHRQSFTRMAGRRKTVLPFSRLGTPTKPTPQKARSQDPRQPCPQLERSGDPQAPEASQACDTVREGLTPSLRTPSPPPVRPALAPGPQSRSSACSRPTPPPNRVATTSEPQTTSHARHRSSPPPPRAQARTADNAIRWRHPCRWNRAGGTLARQRPGMLHAYRTSDKRAFCCTGPGCLPPGISIRKWCNRTSLSDVRACILPGARRAKYAPSTLGRASMPGPILPTPRPRLIPL